MASPPQEHLLNSPPLYKYAKNQIGRESSTQEAAATSTESMGFEQSRELRLQKKTVFREKGTPRFMPPVVPGM